MDRSRAPSVNPPEARTITRLLEGVQAGESEAVGSLLPLVYAELQAMAQGLFASERSGHTLQPTALIHEAWMKFAGNLEGVRDRHHFFALASRAMRQVLTDHARGAGRRKRGDGARQVTFCDPLLGVSQEAFDLVDLEDSLERLSRLNERHARVVELRIFGGLTIAEAAETLGVSHTTVESDWFMSRSWLRRELRRER